MQARVRGRRWTAVLGAAGTLACVTAAHAQAEAPAAPSSAAAAAAAPVVVRANDDTPSKLDHILPEVAGPRITVTKKTDVTKLERLPPAPEDEAPRALFARIPGLFVSEQQTLSRFDFNYRGLGDPQASESVLTLQDGLPIAADWIGAPVLAYLPPPRGLAEVQLVRAGSSLLYGPQAAAINFVSRRPAASAPLSGSVETLGGSDGFASVYGEAQGSSGPVAARGDLGYVRTDAERVNAGSRVRDGDLHVSYRPDARQLWYVDAHLHDESSGEPGRIGYAQFRTDPSVASTPLDHDWVSRYSLTLGDESDLGNGRKFEGKLWFAYQDLASRSAEPSTGGGAAPASTLLQDQLFRSEGADLRLVQRYGRGNALTVGLVAYHDDAPLRRWADADLLAGRDDHAGAPLLRQARTSDYAALFAENVFRLPYRIHLVPSVRLEHEALRVDETLRADRSSGPPARARSTHDTPLFGIGAGDDFGRQNETYFSVTQGYRPVRFLDIAPPAGLATATRPAAADPSRSVTYEAGVHGTPLRGLFYDAGLFWIEVHDRVETVELTPFESVDHLTGDTRHRGFEGEVSYDLLAARGGAHLTLFANLSLLDARFTASATPGQRGKVPGYAPHALARYGLTWRRTDRFVLSVAAVSVSSQYWRDSDAASGEGASFVPARIPGYTVADLDLDYRLTPRLKLLLGVGDLADTRYTSRVYQDGAEPAPRRRIHGGLGLAF